MLRFHATSFPHRCDEWKFDLSFRRFDAQPPKFRQRKRQPSAVLVPQNDAMQKQLTRYTILQYGPVVFATNNCAPRTQLNNCVLIALCAGSPAQSSR
jgi:hypothetical protein